jgi:Tol biopolymer transport system component
VAEGDGLRTTRLTWSNEDFATIPGLPSLPGTLGDLEDSYVFAHPTPSPDGDRVAVFGLLPTTEEDFMLAEDELDDEDDDSWTDMDEALEELTDSLWDEEDDPKERQDDVAGPGVVFALVTDDGEQIVDGDLEALVDLGNAEMSADGRYHDDDDDDDDGRDEVDLPAYWPGGKLYVVHKDGVQVWEVWDTDDGSPTHLEWAPDGRHLLVLHQEDERLHLVLVDADACGVSVKLASGLPVFWDWQPGGQTLVVRVTDPDTEVSVVQLVDVTMQRATRTVGEAGSFYAPAWRPDGSAFAWAVKGAREDRLVLTSADGSDEQVLFSYPGRAAFAWDSRGRHLAVAVAPEGEGPFHAIELVDVEGGATRTLFHGAFVALRWLPDDVGLLVCQADEEDESLHWVLVGLDGSVRPVGVPFLPSQESAVGLHFFEQLGASHPFLSPDGRHVVFSGHSLGEVIEGGPGVDPVPGILESEDDQPPAIYVAPLDGGPTVCVGHGHFACFGLSA